MEFCGKSSRLADFESTVDHGSAVSFDVDSALCLSYVRILGPKRNLYHIPVYLSSGLVGMLLSSSNYFFFSKRSSFNSGVRLLLQWHCVIVIKHVAFSTIWPKLTVTTTCTSYL